MNVIALLGLIAFSFISPKLLNIILNKIIGEENKKRAKEKQRKFLYSMFDFFKQKNTKDRLLQAEKAVIAQREYAFSNIKRVGLLMIYIYFMIRFLRYIYRGTIVISLPYIGDLTWVWTLLLIFLIKIICKFAYNKIKSGKWRK